MADLRGVILAGGEARRFGGTPKGLLDVGTIRILDRLVTAMTEAFGVAPLLVANSPDAATWRPGLEVVPDRIAGGGALGGLLTGLAAAAGPVVCVAWDMPFVPAALLRFLGARLAGFDAVLPASPGPRGVEPLCAAYGPNCIGPIEAQLARGDLRVIGFHPGLRVDVVAFEELRPFGDPAHLFFNVNTPADLARANHTALFPPPAD